VSEPQADSTPFEEVHPSADEDHVVVEGGHAGHGFDFMGALVHHNMPFPAWEVLPGHPFIVFDKARYAAIEIGHQKLPAAELAEAEATEEHLAWAEEVLAEPDFRYNEEALDATTLAKGMAVVDSHALMVFPKPLAWMNQQLFFGTIALILLALFMGLVVRRKPDQLKPVNRLQHFFESITIYLRDEVVRPAIPHGDSWLPFFVTLFFMILAVNLFGLIPGTGTMSGNIGVTGAWATIILLLMLAFGMKEQGPKYWINIVPIPFTWALSPVWVLLFIIETLGLIIKPAALAIRLFANMFAGHTVLLVFFSLGYMLINANPDAAATAVGIKGLGWLLGFAFHAMEVLVAFIQAYVFTLLSALFIGMSIHPEH